MAGEGRWGAVKPSTDRCLNAPPASMWQGPSSSPKARAQAPHVQPRSRFTSSPTASTLRANPYPEVTDPICRFPLPTFFYRLEAVHLGDLMRISVRTGANVQNVTLPPDFQGPVENDHGRRRNAALFGIAFLTACIQNHLAPRRNSMVSVPQAEKKTLPGVLDSFSGLCRVTATE